MFSKYENLKTFSFTDVFFRAELIQAKVPILKLRDSYFFLEVDLNCNNVVGIRNTHLLYCYSQRKVHIFTLKFNFFFQKTFNLSIFDSGLARSSVSFDS